MGIIFSYHAKDEKGEYRDGTIEAENQSDAIKKLKGQSLFIIFIKTVESGGKSSEIVERRPEAQLLPDEKKRIYEEEKYRLETQQKLIKELEINKIKQTLGLIGSTILFIGVFTPILKAPIIGSMNYFQNGKGDGTIIIIFAIISFILTLIKCYKGLWYTGFASLGLMIFTFVNFQMRMSETKLEMTKKLAGNPFRGLADLALQSVQLQWGWALLIVGAVLIISAAALKKRIE